MGFYTNLTIERGADGRAVYARKKAVRTTIDVVSEYIHSPDPEIKALVTQANAAFVQKAVTGTTHVDQTIQNMTVAYRNEDFIAARLMPIIPVTLRSGIYFKYDRRSQLSAPDDAIGARASANEVTRNRLTDNYSVKDYALKDFVDVAQIQNESAPLNDMADATSSVVDLMELKREQRVANILGVAATYGANTTALGSGVRWDVTGGNPIKNFLDARAGLWSGQGNGRWVAFTTLNVWNALVQNAKMQETFKYSRDGLLRPEQFGSYFGFDELLIAASWQDTANEGQTEADSRIWPDVFGLIRVANAPSVRNASFGYTFQVDGQRNARQWFENGVGTKGGWWAQVSSSEDHKIVAADTGYLYTTPIG
jgi:hypothetical protein